jgi:anti-anti-sigma factor
LATVGDSIAFSARSLGLGSVRRIVVRGEVDMASAPELAECVAVAIVESPGDLVFDLTEATFIDSAGLKVIASARRDLPDFCQVILREPQPFVRKVLAIAQMGRTCVIEGPNDAEGR